MSSHSAAAPTVENTLIRAHGLAALAMLGYVGLLGLTVALKFHWPDLLTEESWLTWGRLRYAHTQGVFFGWLGNAFLAFLYYSVPRLADRPVTSGRLGWILFVVWNLFLVLPGWALVQAGVSQPLEWGEFPLVIDAVAVIAFGLTCVQFVLPFLRAGLSEVYVSGWYILGSLVFTLLAYPVGNFVPEFLPGARGAAFSGLWIHDAVGLYVTPLAVATAYVVIPATTGRPIYSHFLAVVGFWLLFLVYPLVGTHHYVFSSIPMDAQKGAILASVYLGVDVILVVANLLLSLRGQSGIVASNVPLRFVWLGVVCYLVVSIQGSLQALMPLNRFLHFSDWVIGHSHFAMIGFASLIAIGGLLHAWERIPGTRYHPSLANTSFWLLTTALLLMVLDLTAAGLVQGQLWQSDAPWIDSVAASQPFWMVRSLAGVLFLIGLLALAQAMLTGPRSTAAPVTAEPPATEPPQPVPGLAWLRSGYWITAVAGVFLFLLSFLVLGLWPGLALQDQMAQDQPALLTGYSTGEQHGRQVYIREGCGNCHSQLTRLTAADVRRFGVPSQAWESERDLPQIWGTRRIGPDLARESGRRPRDWHLAHLWDPRHVVPESIMPRFPWLFEGSATRPGQDALDLVAYLDALGRDARLAGRTGPQALPGLSPEEEMRRGMFCDCAIPRTPGPAILLSLQLEPSELDRYARRGSEVYGRHCGGCHGATGRGDGPAATALLPRPRDLASARFADRHLSEVLWNGVRGSSMPGWHELSAADLLALAAHVRALGPLLADPDEEGPLPKSEHEKAEGLYEKNCSSCHGSTRTLRPAGSVAPVPTDFRRVRPTRVYAEKVLAEGVPSTTMPPWPDNKLTEPERKLLARYVRSPSGWENRMAINLIVAGVTLLVAGFVAVWYFCPRTRPWFEAPKYRVLEWEQRFPSAVRRADAPECRSRD
jgi:cbb3-type cytochrome c oxidase subunit I